MDRESVHSYASGKRIVPIKSTAVIPISGDDNTLTAAKQEEWTTSRKVVNHKTKQVETRVQRQIIMEDGKVIADSGPQVTTKTKEDQKQEESENTNHKNIGDIDIPPPHGYAALPGGNQVVSEKTETHQSSREAKEENIQYHDESFKELTGLEIHRKALQAPNELIKIDADDSPDRPKGKLVHYSSKSHKINDSEEVKETSRLGRDGKLATETTRTHHHEEFDDDEVPEDMPEERKALPESSTETTRNVEYLKDYEQGFDNFPKAMNRQPTQRALESQKTKNYSHNEENVKNTSTTSRWLDDHFGDSDDSDIVETSKTRTGKNVINVSRTGRTSTPISAYAGDYHSIDRAKTHSQRRVAKSPQKYTTTATYYVKDSRSPSPHDYYRPASRVREDASVQASLSDDENRANDFRSKSYTSSVEKQERERRRVTDSRAETPNKPEKTFYFGDDSHQRKEHRSDKQIIEEYLNKQNSQKNSYSVEKENKRRSDYNNNDDWKESGYVSAKTQSRVKSSVNDRVVNDSTSNQNFDQSFNNEKGRDEVEHNLNRFMDWDNHYKSTKSVSPEPEPYWSSRASKPNEYIHSVTQDDLYSSRRDPLSRQRNFESYISPPPLYSSPNTDYKYKYTSSPSPPSSPGGTWTKSKSRTMSPLYRSTSPTDDFPKFSPLSINPLQIKSFTDSYTNGRNHSSN